ncbi:MAG: biotin synthase BioB [Dissulfurimicrobium sp.]|uniref:biotin synthase BioB n=1 Tax=Dissulfurimicrobium sp. TaxID=2022436 RepID=UPI00404B3F7C
MNPWSGVSKDLLRLSDLPLKVLMNQALDIKLKHRADRFSLCTIMNVKSGRCSEDCAFCAQSARFKTKSPVYALKSTDEIINEAKKAKATGAQRFSLVASGRGPNDDEVELYAERISAIRNSVMINICASLGIIGKDALIRLKEAGLSRYHHNLETSARFYPKIVTTHSFDERVNTILAAKQAGLEVCAGGIIGLGETREDRIDMVATLKYLDVDSIPLNILVPIPGTRLASTPPMPIDEILRTIAILRIALPDKAIRIAGGRETAIKDFQALAFFAGADAMLIGGYLTVKGRAIEEDLSFAEKIRGLWRQGYL